ncbi:MAG: hypothetical protein II857_04925, partial [Selenomonadaceae bacterium]|nr:hypothetical protein [Selenomonadaceae bacterium]
VTENICPVGNGVRSVAESNRLQPSPKDDSHYVKPMENVSENRPVVNCFLASFKQDSIEHA